MPERNDSQGPLRALVRVVNRQRTHMETQHLAESDVGLVDTTTFMAMSCYWHFHRLVVIILACFGEMVVLGWDGRVFPSLFVWMVLC